MNNNQIFSGIQMATGLAVVIGLIMVFVELQQAKSLTLAELTSQGYAEAMADFRTIMGENPAPVIAKLASTQRRSPPRKWWCSPPITAAASLKSLAFAC